MPITVIGVVLIVSELVEHLRVAGEPAHPVAVAEHHHRMPGRGRGRRPA